MAQDLIPAWTAEQKRAFGAAPTTFAHRLGESGLFSDGALAELLDRTPPELFDINLFDFDEDGQMSLRTGARGRLPGDRILDGIKQGRMWVQMRSAHLHYPALGELMREAYAGIGAQARGFSPVNLTGQLIVSAPGAKVPFHADAPGVILFHIRGHKRIWIYPADETHMPGRLMELINMRQMTEDLPYRRQMDAAAEVIDLEPGMAVTWPLHAPHRVENLDDFNVSLSTDFQTWGSRLTNGAYYAAGVLRRMGAPAPQVRGLPAAARAGLWGLGAALRRMRVVEDRISRMSRSFELGAEPVA